MVRGIGRKPAKRLVDLFGRETSEVVEAKPARRREVPGIDEHRAGRSAAA